MWKPYLKVFAYYRKTGRLQALQLLDRFHIAMNMNKAIDKVRATETKKLKAQGNDILTRGHPAVEAKGLADSGKVVSQRCVQR